jgi:AcrR family transcriptional regulator
MAQKRSTARKPAAPPELNRAEIIAAACRLINRVGVESFTMRALADELQFSPMAAYRHVSNKEELLFMAVDSVLEGVELPPRDLPWPERFQAVAHAVWAAIEPHRWIPGFLLSKAQKPVPNLERIFDELRDILGDAGLEPDEARKAITMAWTFTGGLLSWAKDPVPYLEFGIEVMTAGLKDRSAPSPPRRR